MNDRGPGRQGSEHSVQILIPFIVSVGPVLPSLLPFVQRASSSKGLPLLSLPHILREPKDLSQWLIWEIVHCLMFP